MELLQRFARGDVEAFEALFRKHVNVVYGWVLRIVREPAAAEDITIEAFWRMYKARNRFDPRREFEPWARRIATNAALKYLGTRRSELALDVAIPAAPMPDPAEASDTRARIERAIARLSPLLRTVATLALIEDRPYREIADALGLSENAVKLRVFRAVRILREQLARQGVVP
ncbi:MAG: RNA polymerase sigma factor [Gemmatimonadaceae bacterium]